MKKLILFLPFIIGMVMKGQVVADTLYYNPNPEFHFVSDDGNGTYTISGHDYSNNDGLLVVYKENVTPHLDVKNFPPDMNHGSVHEPYPLLSYTINDTTYAAGVVANSIHYTWGVIRMYLPNQANYSLEKKTRNCGITPLVCNGNLYMILNVDFNQFSDLMNSGWNITQPGQYFVKLNKQDLSIIWMYQINDDITNSNNSFIIRYDNLIGSTSPVYRYAVQSLPNGNIAVTVGNGNTNGYELWEFDPATGQKLGIIDDSYTDYDRDGVAEMQYRFHRWKVVDGVLYHEFWQDPAAYPDDQQIGHWEKLEVPGYTPGGSTAWDPANLQVTAVSDWETYDSFGMAFADFSIESDGSWKSGGYKLSPKLEPTTGEDIFYGWNGGIRDSWIRSNGDLMAMGLHGLYRFSGQQYTAQPELNTAGTGVVEAHEYELYENDVWIPVAGEGALVLSSLPNVGSQPDPSWWTIPAGYHDGGHTAIMESHRPGEEGQLFFRVAILSDNNVYVEAYRRITLYDVNQVSVPETEIAGLKLYPNPVQDYLTVSADDNIDTVRIYNLLGVIVSESNTNSVYMGNLAHGVYIAEVISGDKISRKKIIKNKNLYYFETASYTNLH